MLNFAMVGFKSKLYTFQYHLREYLVSKSYRFLSRSGINEPIGFDDPKKILFVLAGLIGDSVMSVPAIAEARRIWPSSRIVVLGKKHNRELIEACPFFDEFYECNADPFSLRKAREIKNLENWLSIQKFDVAIILLGDQYAHILSKAKIPVRVGVKGTLLEPCLTHCYDIGSPRTWGTIERLNALRSLGLSVNSVKPMLFVSNEARQDSKLKLQEFGLGNDEKYAILHPFGSTQHQWWNISKIPRLADELKNRFGLRTVLVGKKYDLNGTVVNPQIDEMISSSAINTLGKLNLQELIAIISDSIAVITTDSGPFHIAGALGKPTVGIFRERRPEHANAYPTATVIFGKDSTCENSCRWDACRTNPCVQMNAIFAESIIEHLTKIL